MLQTLRKSGGSLVVTVPKAFVDQNNLTDGSPVDIKISDNQLTLKASPRQRYTITELLAEMPKGLPRNKPWESMKPTGLETW